METENIKITISRQQAQELWDILERIRDEWERQEPYLEKWTISIVVDGTFSIYRGEAAAISGILPQLRNALNK